MKLIKTYTDGGSRGNPGHAAIGVVLKNEEGKRVGEFKEYIGIATNNVAEYKALVKALEMAREMGATEVQAYLDSELVVKQMKREYRVKDPGLSQLFVLVWNLSLGFDKISYHHIRREFNTEADALVNEALDDQALKG